MLVLRLVDVDPARHAAPVEFTCDRHGATLGRGAHVDWVLPDAERRVSSVHAVIQFTGGRYVLEDRSTNGTFLGTAQDRLPGPHELRDGDALRIGPYTVGVQLLGAAPATAGAAAAGGAGAASPNDAWGALAKDYDETAPEISERAWGRKPQRAVLDTPEDIAQGSFVAPPPKPTAQPGGTDVWANLAKTFDDGWGQTSAPAPTTNERPDPVTKPGAAAPAWRDPPASAPAPAAASNANPWADEAGGASSAPSAPSAQPTSAAPPPAAPTSGDLAALAQGLGLAPDALNGVNADATLSGVGRLLRRMSDGLFAMMTARARAKEQLRLGSTLYSPSGNSPLKFSASAEEALTRLVRPADPGFMEGEPAVGDAFADLHAHNVATFAAMQGALRATLARFAPEAIEQQVEAKGFLARFGGKKAKMWDAYKDAFATIAESSDEAFVEVFSEEFRKAYLAIDAQNKKTPPG